MTARRGAPERPPLRCPECLQERPDDERVAAGMKCGNCAYAFTTEVQ